MFCAVLCGCTRYERTEFFALDTFVTITAEKPNGDVLKKAEKLVKDYEDKLSVTKDGSEIKRLNESGTLTLSEEVAALVKLSLSACERTDGALDITVYPLVKAWGFTVGDKKVPSSEELSSLLPLVGYENVTVTGNVCTLENGTELDLGAVAKGYITDKLAELLKENDVKNALISLGGNVYVAGKYGGRDWNVGIKSPFGDGKAFCGVKLSDKAVVTSGQYQRFFEENGKVYGHIIDPATGVPVDNEFSSVTVIGENGFWCDALSTALFVMGKDKALEFYGEHGDFDFIFIMKDGSVAISEGIKDAFSLADENTPLTVIKRNDKN